MSEARTPVLVGVAQVLQRTDDPDTSREPLELMVDAVERAAEDAGSRELLTRAQSVQVPQGLWPYRNPARAVAERIGCPGAQTAIAPFGGQMVQTMVSRAFGEIQRGAFDVVVLTGAECGRTRARLKKQGRKPEWSEAPGKPDVALGADLAMWHEAETARDIRMPIQMYPLFDVALRHARGESVEEHLRRISELWAGFSAVASRNPSAWIPEEYSAEAIRTPGPGNPPVSFPYPMLMNSNSRVDMGAALILTHADLAKSLGVPREKWIHPHASSNAQDHLFVSERDELHESPAIRLAGARVFELAGLEPKAVDHVNLYSCFPSAVQVSARELGIEDGRELTVTGGLTFGGGPLNNYTMHGIARMAEVLREDPGSRGLVSGNGGFLTKHAFCVYSTDEPATPYRHVDVVDEVEALPRREAVIDHVGPVMIEAYSVMYEDGAPSVAHAACRLPDGRRTWANATDPDLAAAMIREEFCGRDARVETGGILRV